MRADIVTPCDPSLPSGSPHTPGGGSGHPRLNRRRKTNAQRIRHLGTQGVVLPEDDGHIQHQRIHSLPLQHQRIQHQMFAAATSTTDPQTLQEKRELLEYFQKLRVLVPSLPKTGKIQKLDVIEHVITYIKQLENQLIDHPMIHVLENNAYISGLLQSMAPDFDISHLFPSRSVSQQSNSSSASNDSSTFLDRPDASEHLSRYPYSEEQSSSQRVYPEPSSLHRSKRSSVRKPFGILSTTNSNK